MRKTSKILALVLVLVMMFAVVSAFSFSASAADPVRVYCDNDAGWTKVYCYYWGGSNGPTWPGKLMTYDADLDLWYYDIPAGHANCIFNNGSGTQSADLKTPTDDKVVYNNSVKGWGVLGGAAEEPEKTKIYVKNTANWSKLYCYAATDGWTAETAWPGNAMTYDADLDLWYYEVMEGYVNIIFNNGSGSQTADLKTPTNDLVVFDNTAGAWGELGGEVVYATYTVAGTGAHLGTEWDVANTANDMVRDEETGVYTKVYENVAAGTYKFKCVENHAWTVAHGGGANADADGNYVFNVATAGSKVIITLTGTTVDVKVEAPHVNTLVVGDTNKIVVTGNTLNDYGLPVEWVPFVADEAGYYSFVGDNGALAFIFTSEFGLVSATGAANLEAGTYLICLGNGVVGEFNVAVTKSAWVNALVEGDNKILITDALDNGAGYYIVWVPFEVTEKANYTFTGEGILALVYDAAYGAVAGTELDVGTYNICVAFLTPATTGVATVTVTKTAIGGGDVETPTHDGEQEFVLGENTVIIDGCTLNLTNSPVEMVKFVVTEKAKYTFVSDINTYISTSSDPKDLTGYLGGELIEEAILEPGTYYICCGNSGALGEFSVTVEKTALDDNCEHEWISATCAKPKTCSKCGETEGEVDPNTHITHSDTCLSCGKDVPSFVVGNNHVSYVPGAPNLLANGDLYVKVEITEPGVYVISGGAPVNVYMWSVPTHQLENGQLTTSTPYVWNVDVMTETGFADYFEITLPEAGVYWIGFKFVQVTEAYEYDVNISFKEPLPVEDPIDPVDPVEPQPEPEPELNFFQKIIAWFKDLISKILGIFKK